MPVAENIHQETKITDLIKLSHILQQSNVRQDKSLKVWVVPLIIHANCKNTAQCFVDAVINRMSSQELN